jgi:DNA-binding transcriptional regulator YiaG
MCYNYGNSIIRGASKMSLGARIRKIKTEKNLSQEKFGKQTGIHPNHIGKYETK